MFRLSWQALLPSRGVNRSVSLDYNHIGQDRLSHADLSACEMCLGCRPGPCCSSLSSLPVLSCHAARARQGEPHNTELQGAGGADGELGHATPCSEPSSGNCCSPREVGSGHGGPGAGAAVWCQGCPCRCAHPTVAGPALSAWSATGIRAQSLPLCPWVPPASPPSLCTWAVASQRVVRCQGLWAETDLKCCVHLGTSLACHRAGRGWQASWGIFRELLPESVLVAMPRGQRLQG